MPTYTWKKPYLKILTVQIHNLEQFHISQKCHVLVFEA